MVCFPLVLFGHLVSIVLWRAKTPNLLLMKKSETPLSQILKLKLKKTKTKVIFRFASPARAGASGPEERAFRPRHVTPLAPTRSAPDGAGVTCVRVT